MNKRKCFLGVLLSFLILSLFAADTSGLMLEWKFDEGQGNIAKDSSGNGRNGNISGATWEKTGDLFALRFSGNGNNVFFKGKPLLGINGPVSVEFWVKPEEIAPKGLTQLIGASLNSYLICLVGNSCIWYVGSGANSISAKIALNDWNHIVTTFDGKQISIWQNGQLIGNKGSKAEVFAMANGLAVAASNPRINQFKGLIDEVRVYNRAISQAEIQKSFAAGVQIHRIAAVVHKDDAPEAGTMVKAEPTPQTLYTDKNASTDFFKNHPNEVDVLEQGDSLLLANRQIGLEFHKTGTDIQLVRLYGIAGNHDFVNQPNSGSAGLFGVVMGLDPMHVKNNDQRGGKEAGILKNVMTRMGKMTEVFKIGPAMAKKSAWRIERGSNNITIYLEWLGVDVKGKAAMKVVGSVQILAGDPMSRWRIEVENHSDRYGIERVYFPNLSFAPIGSADDNIFIYPKWRGGLVKNPFAAKAGLGENYHTGGAYYPYYVNMQFFSLYNQKNLTGLYFGTFDPTPNMIQFLLKNSTSALDYSVGHFPPNMGFKDEDYRQPYDSVIGPFKGDWYDACQIYRGWAAKQTWTAKGKTRDRKDIPLWSKETPLHMYTQLGDASQGSNDIDENQRIAYDHAMEWLKWSGTPLLFNWYGWAPSVEATENNWPASSRRIRNRPGGRWTNFTNRHGTFGNYPGQPALAEMSELSKKLKASKGYLVPYLCATIYDDGSTENAPYAAELKNAASRDLFGNILTYENIGWNMCSLATAWRKRLGDEAAAIVKQENVGGVYLDTVHGMSQPCYWTPHGHSAAGAATGPSGMHRLVEHVNKMVKSVDSQALIEGEDPAENMIDVMDNVLYQRHLRTENKAPLFAAVYADYIPRSTVGKISLSPTPFYLECASLFTEGAHIGRLTLRPRPTNMVLSLNKPEHKAQIDFLALVVGYYKQDIAKKFMCYGQLIRPVRFDSPSPMPMLAYNSDEAGGVTDSGASLDEFGSNAFPALTSGVFLAADNEIGIFIVNAGPAALDFSFNYDSSKSGIIGNSFSVESVEANGQTKNIAENVKTIAIKASLDAHSIRLYRIKVK